MQRNSRHGVHRWIRNVLDLNRNTKFPDPQALVVTRCHKPTPFVHKSNGIDGLQMIIIDLHILSCVQIKLIDFVIGAARHKNILFVVVWMELSHKEKLVLVDGPHHLSRLCVPQMNIAIVTRTEKLPAVIAEEDIAYALDPRHLVIHETRHTFWLYFGVTQVGLHTFA